MLKRLSFQVFMLTTIIVLALLYRFNGSEDVGFVESVFYGFSVVVGLGIAFVSGDMSRRRVSDYHTASTSLSHYLIITILSLVGWVMRRRLEKDVQDTKTAQEKTLLHLLQHNANTVYGQQYQFAGVKSCADFKRSHPLTKYSHYEPYIQRQMQGETSVLTADSPVLFAVTSGTSGKSSVLPMIQRQKSEFFFSGVSVALSAMLNNYSGCCSLQKTLKFFYNPTWRTAPNGVPIGPGSSTPSTSGKLLDVYSTPLAAFNVLHEPTALYLHLLFGLRDRNIGILESNFTSTIYMGFRALDAHWEQLASDIEQGRVVPRQPGLDIEPGIRETLNTILTPDPKRASEIRQAFKEGSVGVAKKLWPYCNLIVAADTGAFALYGRLLQENHCRGIPIFSCLYAASEGLIGINIWPQITPARYLLVPTVMFMEFIPVDRTDEPQPDTLLMHQVEPGCVYELVITTVSGLCRYRFGDVVKVVAFYHTCPVIEFMYRQGQLLNVHCEKTSEATFYQALSQAVSRWQNVTLTDYCCAESVLHNDHHSRVSPYYIVFLELEGTKEDLKLAQMDFSMIDTELCQLSYVYKSYRDKKSIGPIVVHSVLPGTFQRLRGFMLERNMGSSNQYKVPRVVKRTETLQFLMMNRIP